MPTANHTMQPEKEEAEHRVHGSFLKELHVLLLLASHSLQVSHVASSSCKGGRKHCLGGGSGSVLSSNLKGSVFKEQGGKRILGNN